MYHIGSPGDIALVVLALGIFGLWIVIWALHCISIMYGKWRLHRSTTVQIPSLQTARIRQQTQHQAKDYTYICDETVAVQCSDVLGGVGGGHDDSSQLGSNSCSSSSSSSNLSTIIQVERDGDQRHFTLLNGGMLPGVSILKPLVGIDQYLMLNLESFFTMAYPRFELLFCVPDESDPAVMVVRSLMNKYPTVDARIFIGGENVGVNPKINNMMPGYRACVYDLLLVSDSSIMMRDDTLLDMVLTMLLPDLDRDQPKSRLYRTWDWIRNRGPTHGIGLVHQMPYCMDREEFGFPACLEKVYFGAFQARIYLFCDCIGMTCCTGMSTLVRKNLLENKGGLSVFGRYLAEDQFIARAVIEQKWRTSISSQPAWQNSAVCNLTYFQDRLERWTKLRLAMMPVTTVLEPMIECIPLGILASLSVSFLFEFSVLAVFLLHVITWFLLDWTLLNTIQRGRLSFSKLDFIMSWVFREGTSTVMFVKSLLSPRIQWKNGYYRLKWGGLAEIIKSPDPPVYCRVSPADYIAAPCPNMNLLDMNPSRCSKGECELEQAGSLLNGDLLSFSPTKTKSRHVRSRSLPQKSPMASLLQNLSRKLYGQANATPYSCDDLATGSYPFHVTSSQRDVFSP